MSGSQEPERLEFVEPFWLRVLPGGAGIALAWVNLLLGSRWRHPTMLAVVVAVTVCWLVAALWLRRRQWGVRLTAAGVRVRGLRTRGAAWSDVDRIEVHGSRLRVITRHGTSITLPVPTRSWRDPAAFDSDAQRIIDWWHAHGDVSRTHQGDGAGYPWPAVPTASADPWAAPPS